MENETSLLVLELSRLEELFKTYLAQPSRDETLTLEILSSLSNAMSIAKTSVLAAQQPPYTSDGTASEVRMMTKKRKTIPKSTIQPKVVVKVGRVEGTDGPPGDSYSWRKYGQKDIQNDKYPRCYYRCAHSETRNCQAKKRVQQCGENPTTFEVSYIHTHICCPSPQQQRLQDQELQQVLASDLTAPSLSFPAAPESFLHGGFVSEVSGTDHAVPKSFPHSGFQRGVPGINQAAPSLPFPTIPESCPYSDFVHEVSVLDLAVPSLPFPTIPESCPYNGVINEVSGSDLATPSLWFSTNPESYLDSSAGELLNEQLSCLLFFSETSGSNYSVSDLLNAEE